MLFFAGKIEVYLVEMSFSLLDMIVENVEGFLVMP